MKKKLLLVTCVLIVLSFCPMVFSLDISSPAILVPGWEPNPNSDQEISYISPNADFMFVSVHHWPNRYVAKRTWNPATNLWDPAENLGLTGADNTHGSLSPNMNMLFYGAGYYNTMIHRSTWSGSSWLPGEQIFYVPSWCPMFTGSKLYFNIVSPVPGYMDDLAVSDYNSVTDQFSPYTPISELNTEYYEDAPWVSSDGKLMLFQSDRPGGYGGVDIWSAAWDAGSQKWGNITNLGPCVNTSGNERFPRIAEEAQLLFFIRDWTLMQAPVSEPPVANAGNNIQIASAEQADTVIMGTATDPDGDILEYRWLEGEEVLLDWSGVSSGGEAYLDLATLPYFSIGNHTLILEAREVKSCGLSASDDMVLTIENSPPVVQAAPKHQVVEVGVDPIVVVGDAGDFDGDTLSYEWLDESNNILASGTVATTPRGEPVTIPDLNVPAGDARFPVGEHTVRLQVSDGINEPVTDSVSVEVTDTTAPSLSPVPSVTILWPPNHELIPVTIWANAFDNGGGDIVLSVTVQSSEPADTIGDGNTDVDYYIDLVNNETGVIELRLRSERSGKGGGRVYTITITATDANQNQSNATVQILAPHDKSKK